MTFRICKIAVLASLFGTFAVSAVHSQNETKPTASPQQHKAAGTKSEVEKRLKAEEKPASSATRLDAVTKSLTAHRFQQTAISPDGAKVAWVEILTGKDGAPSGNTSIYLKNLKTDAPAQRITAGVAGAPHAEGNVAWSGDSRQLASSPTPRKKIKHSSTASAPTAGSRRNSRKSKAISTLPSFRPTTKLWPSSSPKMQRAPPVRSSPKLPKPVKSKTLFSSNASPSSISPPDRLRQISPADTYIYEYSWSPDNQHLAVTSAQGNGDNNWYIAELNILDATTGLMNSIYKPQLQIARPAWSPDGKTIAFVEGLMSDEPSVGGDVFSIPAAGGTPKNLIPIAKPLPANSPGPMTANFSSPNI